MKSSIASDINLLAKFCGKKDIETLTPSSLKKTYGIEKVDVLVLFGGSILSGGDLFAKAIQNKIASQYVIVGGYGHTSAALFSQMETEIPGMSKNVSSEAELFNRYILEKYQIQADFLETQSTNCGNNVTFLLALLKQQNISIESILMIQDAAMQQRMDATLRKYALNSNLIIINYPAYEAEITIKNDNLVYSKNILGMWSIERYIQLLMGEIPRLRNDRDGYGPNGKDFIAPIEIPLEVLTAYDRLKIVFPDMNRTANPLYATKPSEI